MSDNKSQAPAILIVALIMNVLFLGIYDAVQDEPEASNASIQVTNQKEVKNLTTRLDAEIIKLDRWIRSHTIERFGPTRVVEQKQVFEIAFEGVMESKRHKCGLAVRFPRIHRWRIDKPTMEADCIEQAQALLKKNECSKLS